MTKKSELMALGMAPGLADEIGFDDPATGLTATGTTQATAYPLTSNFSVFGTVGASAGAMLPLARSKGPVVIYNGGANMLTIYPNTGEPASGGTINGGSSASLPANKSAVCFACGNQWIANISA